MSRLGQQDEDLDTKVKPLLQKASNESAAELLSEQANKPVLDIDTPTKPARPNAELLSKPAHEPIVVDTLIQPARAIRLKSTADDPVNNDSPGDSKLPTMTQTTCDNPVVLPDTPIANPKEDVNPVLVNRISLESAYKFVGVKEFVQRPLDSHTVRQATRNNFVERPKQIGYGEAPMFARTRGCFGSGDVYNADLGSGLLNQG